MLKISVFILFVASCATEYSSDLARFSGSLPALSDKKDFLGSWSSSNALCVTSDDIRSSSFAKKESSAKFSINIDIFKTDGERTITYGACRLIERFTYAFDDGELLIMFEPSKIVEQDLIKDGCRSIRYSHKPLENSRYFVKKSQKTYLLGKECAKGSYWLTLLDLKE